MHIDLNGVGGFIALCVAGLIGLVAIYAYSKAVFAKSSIEALRGDRDDLQERCDRLEHEVSEFKQREKDRDEADIRAKADFDKRLADEVAKRETLEGVVTGKEQLDRIIALLEQVTLVNTRNGVVLDRIAKEMGLNVS